MQGRHIWKTVFFLACLTPLGLLVYRFLRDDLGVNPVETLTHGTGDWALRLLIVTLSVTPLRRWFHWNELIHFRRMAGLFAFFYAGLHFLIWLWLDKGFGLKEMWIDVAKRRYLTAGMLGFAVMAPLAITSTKGWIRRLGRNWARLHRLTYVAAVAGVAHYFWLVKSDIRKPALYGAMAAALLLARVWHARAKPRAAR